MVATAHQVVGVARAAHLSGLRHSTVRSQTPHVAMQTMGFSAQRSSISAICDALPAPPFPHRQERAGGIGQCAEDTWAPPPQAAVNAAAPSSSAAHLLLGNRASKRGTVTSPFHETFASANAAVHATSTSLFAAMQDTPCLRPAILVSMCTDRSDNKQHVKKGQRELVRDIKGA